MKHSTLAFDPQVIPVALRNAKRWLVFRLVDKPGSDKPDKVPYYTSGARRFGKQNGPGDLARLATFEQAIQAMADGSYDGLGFALGMGYQGLDLDGVRDPKTKVIAPWALKIIEATESYAEVSPSGTGVHILGFGREKLEALRANHSGVEFYATHQFFTVTGIPLNGKSTAKLLTLAPVYSLAEQRWLKHGQKRGAAVTISAPPASGKAPLTWPGDLQALLDYLPYLSADVPNDEWVKIGMIIHHACNGAPDGLALWDEWSKSAPKRYQDGECAKRWRSFRKTANGVTMGTLIKMGRESKAEYEQAQKNQEQASVPHLLPFIDILAAPLERAPLIEGWLYERIVTLQAADGGSGKSYLGVLEAMIVAGGFDCGLGLKVRRGKVLLYSGEDDAHVIRARMRAYCNYFGWDIRKLEGWLAVVDRSETDCVLYSEAKYGATSFTDEYELLRLTVASFRPVLLVIDNASHTFNANENDRAKVRHYLSGLTALQIAVLLLAHVNKVAAADGSTANTAVAYSGSTAWSNTVRARRVQALDEGKLEGSVTVAKSNYGPTGTVLRYTWNDQAKVFVPTQIIARAAARDNGPLLLGIIKDLSGRFGSILARSPTYIGKLMRTHPAYPAGVSARDLRLWLENALHRGLIEESELKKANRKMGKCIVLTAAGEKALKG